MGRRRIVQSDDESAEGLVSSTPAKALDDSSTPQVGSAFDWSDAAFGDSSHMLEEDSGLAMSWQEERAPTPLLDLVDELETEEPFVPDARTQQIIVWLQAMAQDALYQVHTRIGALDSLSSSSGSQHKKRKKDKIADKPVKVELIPAQGTAGRTKLGKALLLPRPTSSPSTGCGAKELAILFRVILLLIENLRLGTVMTKRDLYYKDVALFKKQAVVDVLLDDIAATMRVQRHELGVVAASKGLFAGPLLLRTTGGADLDGRGSMQGCLIPPDDDIQAIEVGHEASYVLIIEKEAVFRTMVAAHLQDAILVTGKGYGDVATCELIVHLADHGLPCYALVDADPHGLDILSVYCFGSAKRSYDSRRISTDRIEWLGARYQDLARHGASLDSLLSLSTLDRHKALAMLARDPPLPDSWRTELMLMLHRNRKFEIEAIPDVVSYVQTRLTELTPFASLMD